MPPTKYERGKAADAAPKPQDKRPCEKGVLQLRRRELSATGRRGRVRMSAAHFLFAALQMVSRRRPAP